MNEAIWPAREILERGQRISQNDVTAFINRMASVLKEDDAQDHLSIAKTFVTDRVRRTIRGEIRHMKLAAGKSNVTRVLASRFVLNRDDHEVQIGGPRVRFQSHVLARYFRRMGQGHANFRTAFVRTLAESCFLAPLLRPQDGQAESLEPIAVATRDGLLCGATQTSTDVSYMSSEMWLRRGGTLENRTPLRYSPLISPRCAAVTEFKTFIDRDSLSGPKARLYDRLGLLQDSCTKAADMHLAHVAFGQDYDAEIAGQAVADALAFRESPEWKAYVAATRATWAAQPPEYTLVSSQTKAMF